MKKRGIRIALKGGHEFYQKGYSKEENFHLMHQLKKLLMEVPMVILKRLFIGLLLGCLKSGIFLNRNMELRSAIRW